MTAANDQLYFAHIASDGRRQTVEEHLRGTAALCRRFAEAFSSAPYGDLAGLAHDIGKYSEGFQKRLEGGPRVDHSSAGALECAAIGQELVGMCVAGHHAGLPDFGNFRMDLPGDDTFVGRVKKALKSRGVGYPGWRGPLPETPKSPFSSGDGFAASLWTRMLYSCLVDADFLDTEAFMNGGVSERGGYDDIETLGKRLTEYTDRWRDAKSELNLLRNRVREDCVRAGQSEKGLFSLTVPTGGGKTVSSLAFALEHARKHGMARVIYVIPFTSIIEQNAAIFREILGDRNVLEHHSEADLSYDEDLTEKEKRAALAAENWDAPVIVTTAVQFFESLYANKPSKCRKLHNIADSVLIFDEAQSIPIGHLRPCMAAIGTLVKHFGVSAVLCSATQPFVSDLLEEYAPGTPVCEICRDVHGTFEKLKRVEYHSAGQITLEKLACALSGKDQVLCVVNTRKEAKELYDLLPPEGCFHLSTLMTPRHRRETLDRIRQRLKERKTCRVVSTSLIEAGVDIDFPAVYRELTGLDSIVQAGGRCNREGKRSVGESVVTIFSTCDQVPPMLRINIGASLEALQLEADIGKKETVDRYFRSYRSLIGGESLDKSGAVRSLTEGKAGCLLPFETVAASFHLIDENTETVYIPTEESAELIERIKNGTADRKTYRLAGGFSVSVYESHYNALIAAGDIVGIAPGAAVLMNGKQYSEKTGLSLSADSGRAEFI